MVRRLLIALWLTLLSTVAWAQPQLSVTADKHDIALGAAITVTIRAQDTDAALDTLNLDALKPDFDIYSRSSSKQTELVRGKLSTIETTNLILYPLRSGQMQLPAFTFGTSTSRPVSITVHDSDAETPQVIFKPSLTPAHPLTREVATLSLDIYDDGSLQWTPPKLPTPAGTYVRELAQSQWDTTLNGSAFTVHRMTWAIMPLNSGNMTLTFPIMNAVKFGNRLRYAVPPLQFAATPAPRYLPVYVPIGKLSVSSQPPTGELILNRPANWNLIVRGTGISAEGLRKLLPEMMGSDSVHFYPPQIRFADGNDKSLEQTLLVTLPFQPLRAGSVQLPEIILPYYNPATGLIESATAASTVSTVTNPLWHTVIKLITITASLVLIAWLAQISLRLYRRKRIRQASLQRMAAATTPQQLSRALLDFDWGSGPLPANTLRAWLSKLDYSHGNHAALNQLVQQLESACYDPIDKKSGWENLQQALIREMQTIAK
ncbi:BatD family protein [Sulfuriferula thiophila]|uniref:BatD family protein n=1 Tax=Sulfuriferula thiophila TaxID=1781211 RepID=UPI000F60DFC6|nr:BatD family protein [Sulfuriferula thiophila]